jgi:glyoxylase-like metal-dependent hydrolase (beta-lactamase superfamily II)
MAQFPYKVSVIGDRRWAIEEKALVAQGLMYLVEGRDAALLIDTGFGIGDLRALVSGLTNKPVSVVNTHPHFDHIGCNSQFDSVWLHEDDREVLRLHTDRPYLTQKLRDMLPGIIRFFLGGFIKKLIDKPRRDNYQYLRDGHRFDLGGRIIEVIHTPGHTPGSICLLDQDAGILYSGDTVCAWGILLNLELSLGPAAFLASMEKLDALKDRFTAIYPGHHQYSIGPDFVRKYRNCARGIIDGTVPRRPLKTSGTPSFAAEYENIRIALPKE